MAFVDYVDLRLQTGKKPQNIKTLKETRPENLTHSKFIGRKAIMNLKHINPNLTWIKKATRPLCY